jgi:hypothetical protein
VGQGGERIVSHYANYSRRRSSSEDIGLDSEAMSVWERLAEAKIVEAMERGEFDRLPGAGRPLEPEDLSRVPPHLRLGHKLLRNANFLPPEMELRRENYSLDRLIEQMADPDQLEELRRRRRENELRYSLLVERNRAGRRG